MHPDSIQKIRGIFEKDIAVLRQSVRHYFADDEADIDWILCDIRAVDVAIKNALIKRLCRAES